MLKIPPRRPRRPDNVRLSTVIRPNYINPHKTLYNNKNNTVDYRMAPRPYFRTLCEVDIMLY